MKCSANSYTIVGYTDLRMLPISYLYNVSHHIPMTMTFRQETLQPPSWQHLLQCPRLNRSGAPDLGAVSDESQVRIPKIGDLSRSQVESTGIPWVPCSTGRCSWHLGIG